MQHLDINGTVTYADNIKTLTLGESIKLLPNKNNRLCKMAVGAYKLDGTKIGYINYKSDQIDINRKFIVTNLNLFQRNPIITIGYKLDECNFINVESDYIKIRQSKNNNFYENTDLLTFSKYLKRKGVEFSKLKILYRDDNYINLSIQTYNNINIYYIVTKLYYDHNIFKYEEFYKFNLIPLSIYQPFQIHRLEEYLKRAYTSIETCLSNIFVPTMHSASIL
jgi:hypothetical protein